MDLRGMRIVLIIITSVVLALFMVTPFLMSAGSVVGLSGTPIIMDFGHIWADLDPISAFIYGFGDVLCHQQSERSIVLNGSQMAVCVRDLFIVAGFLSGMVMHLVIGRRVCVRSTVIIVALATVLILTDHTIQSVLGLNVPVTRAITGSLFGAVISTVVECWFQHYESISHAHLY